LGRKQEEGTLSTAPSEPPQIRAQRSYFLDEEAEYFVLSIARPLALQPGTNSGVSVGFLMNDTFRKRVRCWQDESIPQVEVNLTCERCPLPHERCTDRVAPPTIHQAEQDQARTERAVDELLTSVRDA
jgi:hypothetical protein